MKNLYTYISLQDQPQFDDESEKMLKVQVDNSLGLGWKSGQILLITNFPYTYHGINAIVLDNHGWRSTPFGGRGVNKIITFQRMFQMGMVTEDMFFHDLDAFQNYPFFEIPKEYQTYDICCAAGGVGKSKFNNASRYNAGTIFFKSSAKDLIDRITKESIKNDWSEEDGFTILYPPATVHKHFGLLDISYNLTTFNVLEKYRCAKQPIQIVHFHPSKKQDYEYYCLGKNELHHTLTSTRVKNLIQKHFNYA